MIGRQRRVVRASSAAASVGLPKGIFAALRRQPPPIRVDPLLLETASLPVDGVYQRLQTRPGGLTTEEADARLAEHGLNIVAADRRKSLALLVWHAVINPLVLLLAVLASISFSTGDARAGIVMSVMIVLGVVLRLTQEPRADTTAAKLQAMITVTATVLRDGQPPQEVPIAHLVPGDVVKLAAGDMIPADVRLLAGKDLFLIQSLTGESFPVEKFAADTGPAGPLAPGT